MYFIFKKLVCKFRKKIMIDLYRFFDFYYIYELFYIKSFYDVFINCREMIYLNGFIGMF